MVRVWKIGSDPGVPGLGKKGFWEIASKNGFTAIGGASLGDLSKYNRDKINFIEEVQKKEKEINGKKSKERRVEEKWNFRSEIKCEAIILQYLSKDKVYIGKVVKEYYFVKKGDLRDYFRTYDKENRAPNRIDVDWKFNENFLESNDKPKSFNADFRDWEDTIHEVTLSDLSRKMDEELRGFLSDVLNKRGYDSELIKSVEEPRVDTKRIIEDDTDENTEKRFKDVDETLKSKSPDVLEGIERVKEAVFISKSRNRKIVDEKKRNSNYTCEVCGFNFEKMYGDIGKKFIVAHHLRPIGIRGEKGEITRQEDIALVCENCHRMLHIRGPHESPYTLEELKNRISKEKGI